MAVGGNPTKIEEPPTPEKGKKKADFKAFMTRPVGTLKHHELSAVLALGLGEERMAVANANSTKTIVLSIIPHRLPDGVYLFLPGETPQDLVPARVSRITGEGGLLWHPSLARCDRPPTSKGDTADGAEGLDGFEVDWAAIFLTEEAARSTLEPTEDPALSHDVCRVGK